MGSFSNSTLILDLVTWSDNDLKMMEATLQNFLPLIRFFGLSSKDFFQKVHPYKKLLNPKLESYLDPDTNEPRDNILPPRYKNVDRIIDSKIVNLNIVSVISRWIDKIDIKNKYAYIRELHLPYEFKLLLRGSRDGFTPNKFHALCENVPHSVTFIKLKEEKEIIGGYNPLIWTNSGGSCGKWGRTNDSFIFSFKNKNNFKKSILSRVKNMNEALIYYIKYGPTFSTDLFLGVKKDDDGSKGLKEYNISRCIQRSYEKKIRDTGNFLIEDYEVFQILKKGGTRSSMDLD